MDDDEDLVDFGPQTQSDHRKAEVAKFKSAKKPKKLVKQNRHRWQSFNERLDGVQVTCGALRLIGRRALIIVALAAPGICMCLLTTASLAACAG
jgi:hypothetical protein